MKPLAIFLELAVYAISMRFLAISCLNQWLWILTCRSLINKTANSEFTRRIVWLLSYWIRTLSLSNITLNSLRSLLRYSASLIVYNKPSNSAFIINVVTVSCLLIFYAISPPNRRIAYPYKLFRFIVLLVNNVFNAISKSSPPPNLNPNVRVLCK